MDGKDFDIVILGATGFTGRLVAETLAARHPQDGRPDGIRWAMGGRDAARLAAVRDEIGAPAATPLVIADAADPGSLQQLMSRTRLVLSTVGPYQLHGSALLAACAASGVDYVDLCGEPAWMRQMIDAHEDSARRSGARIVFSCGFDSVPFDLGVFVLQDEFRQRFAHPANRVRGRVRQMKGTFSGGTAASLKATMAAAAADAQVLQWLRSPFSLTPGFEGVPQPAGSKPMIDEALGLVDGEGVWVAPFIMAAINTKNIHRSNALQQFAYGADFVYDEMLITGPGARGEALARRVAADRSLASDDGPKPGDGPSRQERDSGFYELLFIGEDTQGHRLAVNVRGDKDPGYGSTSRMIAECAVCLLREAPRTPGGIWTPAAALGHALVARLQAHAGLRFGVE